MMEEEGERNEKGGFFTCSYLRIFFMKTGSSYATHAWVFRQ